MPFIDKIATAFFWLVATTITGFCLFALFERGVKNLTTRELRARRAIGLHILA